MARKTNYSFEKRQRELQKKEKKAAKAEAKKALRQEAGLEPGAEAPEAGDIAPDASVEADKAE